MLKLRVRMVSQSNEDDDVAFALRSRISSLSLHFPCFMRNLCRTAPVEVPSSPAPLPITQSPKAPWILASLVACADASLAGVGNCTRTALSAGEDAPRVPGSAWEPQRNEKRGSTNPSFPSTQAPIFHLHWA